MKSLSLFPTPMLIALACLTPHVALATPPAGARLAPPDCAMPMHRPDMDAPGHTPGLPSPLPMPPALAGIVLSDAQQDAVFDLMLGQMRGAREQMKIVARIETDLRTLTYSPDYDDARARTLIENLSVAQARLRLIQIHTDRQIYVLLTPEQRRQVGEAKAAGMATMPPQSGPMPGPRPGMMPPPDGINGPMERMNPSR
jgi:Spy/CpxP family protein refolding chaperone